MRWSLFALLFAACGARTELRTGAGVDASVDASVSSDATPDAPKPACSSLAQIAATGSKPDAIVIDGDFVYWHDSNGISRVAKAGGAAQQITSDGPSTWPDLSPFAIAGGQVYFDEPTGGVKRVPVTGGTPTALGFSAPNAGFAATAAHVYFWTRTSGSTQVIQLDISSLLFGQYDDVPEPPNVMRFDGDAQAIATADPGVFAVHLGGHTILSGLTSTDVVFDATHVYFTSDDVTNGARVMTLVLATLATTPIADTAGAFAIARDANDLYFTDRKSLRVRRIANATGPVTDVATSASGFEPVDLALDGACVYWTSSAQANATAPGAIMVAPKH